MDLVDEQHVARLEVGEDGREIAGALDHRPGSGAKAHTQFPGDDLCERRFAEAGWAMKKHMIKGFSPRLRRLDEDCEILAAGFLADKLRERLRAQGRLGGILV